MGLWGVAAPELRRCERAPSVVLAPGWTRLVLCCKGVILTLLTTLSSKPCSVQ